MSDDFLKDMTGTPDADAPQSSPKLIVPGHAVNHIELEIVERMMLEMSGLLPAVFIDPVADPPALDGSNGPWRKLFDGRLPEPWEAVELTGELEALIAVKYVDRIEIARSLGPQATEAEFKAACRAAGITP